MIAALTLVLPLSLGGAISPMLLTEQTVLLGTGGRRAANRFALGAVLALLVIVTLVVFAGHLIELPTEPTLSRTLDVVLGIALLAIGCATYYVGEHPLRRPKREGHDGERRDRLSLVDHPNAAFPFGAVSMATNFTNLALVVVAAKGSPRPISTGRNGSSSSWSSSRSPRCPCGCLSPRRRWLRGPARGHSTGFTG